MIKKIKNVFLDIRSISVPTIFIPKLLLKHTYMLKQVPFSVYRNRITQNDILDKPHVQ